MILHLPTLPLPGHWLLSHTLLFAASAALLVSVTLGAVLVGRLLAWGFGLGKDYWRGQ